MNIVPNRKVNIPWRPLMNFPHGAVTPGLQLLGFPCSPTPPKHVLLVLRHALVAGSWDSLAMAKGPRYLKG